MYVYSYTLYAYYNVYYHLYNEVQALETVISARVKIQMNKENRLANNMSSINL